MKNFDEINEDFDEIEENHTNNLINNLLSKITPKEQRRIEYKMKLAAKIYAALKSKGWKSLDLAQALKLKSPSIISRWLSGTHNFTADTLFDIQEILEINLLDVELSKPSPRLDVTFIVRIEPSSLNEDIYEPLQRVIDEVGGIQATTFTLPF
jgi:transcriptional regulator with XRE-family HTH domain